jgi:ATP-dependent DNA helicase PIF1
MELSKEQQIAFNLFKQGKNVFITGPAGSGKSELIKIFYNHAIEQFKSIQICALTGCAAVLLGCKARTLHSWSGIGLGNSSVQSLVTKITKTHHAKTSWRTTHILIVDEVSMLSKKLFEILNSIGQFLRRNNNPFGGIQLVFSGDFYQLPPVGNKEEDPDTEKFCFESDKWNQVFDISAQIQLIKIFRQQNIDYALILNKIRQGKITSSIDNLLKSLVSKPIDESLVTKPTQLCPVRKTADCINQLELKKINIEPTVFKMEYLKDIEIPKGDHNLRRQFSTSDISNEWAYLSKNVMCDEILHLKVGSQVMSTINIQSEDDSYLVVFNGSQGIITKFCEVTRIPYVKFNSGLEMAMGKHIWMSEKIPGVGVSQIPLILAWALTIHKSQGASLDAAEIDIGSDIFEGGQTYVALSRVRTIEGIYLKSYDVSKIKTKKCVKEYYNSLIN